MQTNPYEKYKQQSVMTMTQGEMLTKLFDEVIKQLSAGLQFMEQGDNGSANQALQKAQTVVNYLRQNLNHDYQVSDGLDQLYEYFVHRIVQANIRKDQEPLREVIPMITELRDTFVAADRSTRMQ